MKNLDKFIIWHKLLLGKIQVFLKIDNYQTVWLAWIKGFVMGIILMMLLSGCYGIHYKNLTDAEYSDLRESHASVTYYDNQIYWGWNSGYYYYYGIPHYYPWYVYYNACPPSHYNTTTHVIITRPVNRPTHRPTRPNTHRTNIRTKSNTNIIVTPNRNTKVKTNTIRTKNNTKVKTNIKVKTNRNNTRTKVNHRKPK